MYRSNRHRGKIDKMNVRIRLTLQSSVMFLSLHMIISLERAAVLWVIQEGSVIRDDWSHPASMALSGRQRTDNSECSGPLSAAVKGPLTGMQIGNRKARCWGAVN